MVKKLIKIVTIVWVIVMTIAIGISYFYNNSIKNPLKDLKAPITIDIKSGDTITDIFTRINTKIKLRNSFIVKYYAKGHSSNIKISADSQFDVKPGMTTTDILVAINTARPKDPNVARVTIPEGSNLEDIAKLLESKGIISKDAFIESCKKYELPSYIKKDSKRKYALEGYLFPDTYDFKKVSSGKAVIDVMIKNFEKKFAEAQDHTTSISEDGWDKIITMASIVEGEIEKPTERKLAASVFYNRLKINMKLESCATVQYAIGQHKPVLDEKDYQANSPYNTYIVSALPEGPICNPGISCIEAALSPADTKYLYFVSKNDGTHEFNESFEKHQAAVRKYQSQSK